jgi:transcriptional regulator NrdR family protein
MADGRKDNGRAEQGHNCPECKSGQVHVVDTRLYNGYRLRRRKCGFCEHRWSMYEVTETDMGILRAVAGLDKAAAELDAVAAYVTKVAEKLRSRRANTAKENKNV